MKALKTPDIAEMSKEELAEKLASTQESLYVLRCRQARRQKIDIASIRVLRHDIARILTHAKQRGIPEAELRELAFQNQQRNRQENLLNVAEKPESSSASWPSKIRRTNMLRARKRLADSGKIEISIPSKAAQPSSPLTFDEVTVVLFLPGHGTIGSKNYKNEDGSDLLFTFVIRGSIRSVEYREINRVYLSIHDPMSGVVVGSSVLSV